MSNFRETLKSLPAALDNYMAQHADYVSRLERQIQRLREERDELEKVLRDHDIIRDGKLREL